LCRSLIWMPVPREISWAPSTAVGMLTGSPSFLRGCSARVANYLE
jgi:hypothetical protein